MDCRTIAPWLLGGWGILIAAGDARAQTAASFTVDAALPVAAGQPEIALLLDQKGEATLGVIRQGGTNTSAFGLHVSNLQDPQGQTYAAATVPSDQAAASGEGATQFTAPSGVARVRIRVTPPTPSGRLTGTLTLLSDTTTMTWRLNVQPPPARPAPVLAVDTPAQTLTLERCGPLARSAAARLTPWWSCDLTQPLGDFSARVYDKNRSAPLEGVWARGEQIAKAGDDFNVARVLRFSFNGAQADLFAPDVKGIRRVPADSVGNITGQVMDLAPGEYAATLRFGATNSTLDDAQKMTFAISAKDGIWSPAIVLALAVLASFYTTKFVRATFERLKLKARIAQLNASWLRNEPPTSAVVWAQANLRLARGGAQASWVSIPEILTERVAQVEAILPTLRGIRDVRHAIEGLAKHRFVVARAIRSLGRVAARSSDPPLTSAAIEQISASLTALAPWSQDDQVMDQYWTDVVRSLKALLAHVDPTKIADLAERKVLEDLEAALKPFETVAAPPDNAVDVEANYAALEVLWQRRNDPAIFKKLIAAHQAGKSVEELFKITDDVAWQDIKGAVTAGKARVLLPSVPPQAYEPFVLRVTTGDDALDRTFLFRFGLKYRWSIDLYPHSFGGRWIRRRGPLTPESLEPIVMQYSPWKGEVVAGLTIWRGTSDSIELPAKEKLAIHKSETFPLIRGFEAAETVPLVLAAVVALGTGLSTFYAGSATFGSLKDYLALFLWGAAIDQSKNALQTTTTTTTVK